MRTTNSIIQRSALANLQFDMRRVLAASPGQVRDTLLGELISLDAASNVPSRYTSASSPDAPRYDVTL
ncbi:MAG TPA: hypothetical protein VM076_05030 [Gemmatimonadaceae bacterium]|nr:hypothetical protein [Gemmatimonadaceae bacterium]